MFWHARLGYAPGVSRFIASHPSHSLQMKLSADSISPVPEYLATEG
jgi:hypothetical protein